MKIDLTPLVQAVVAVLASLITAYVVPWIKSHTTANQRALALSIVETAVLWVEQVYWEEEGEEKFRLAKERVEKELAEHNIKLDADTVTAMIEEEVLRIHNELKNNIEFVIDDEEDVEEDNAEEEFDDLDEQEEVDGE